MTRTEIYRPTETDNSGEAVRIIEETLSTFFGGFTAIRDCEGGWKNDRGEVVYDNVDIYVSYHDNFHAVHDVMGALAEEIKELTGEESIMYTVNDQAFYINE